MAQMFQKTLNDMIKGIRANPQNEAHFVAKVITEIRSELASTQPSVKQHACLKLFYLHMLGHDVSWAAFHFVDLMSSPRFRGKRIGFLAAAESFNDATDVLLLTTNLFRKSFASSAQNDASLALTCLARIVTPELGTDLLADVTSMLSSSRPLVRKKAVIAIYRVLRRFPEALPSAFPRLRERLDDPDPDVVSATLNVLTELATKNPEGYLGLAPALYRLLTTSQSNWALIKVVKFLRQLLPFEPRLAKKLVQPLRHQIETAAAKSLQFECLYTVASTMATSQPELAAIAATLLKTFVESADPNLKSLGLVALAELQAADRSLVEPCRDAILACLDGEASVRTLALGLVSRMVSRATLAPLVAKLLAQISLSTPSLGSSKLVVKSHYRDQIVGVILDACKLDGFAHVQSFRWLVTTLYTLTEVQSKHGADIAQLMLEVSLRVKAVRAFAAERSLEILQRMARQDVCEEVVESSHVAGDSALLAASYVLGEHSSELPLVSQCSALSELLSPSVAARAPDVQASCVQASIRVLTQLPVVTALNAVGTNEVTDSAPIPPPQAELSAVLRSTCKQLQGFCRSPHSEVAERACSAFFALSTVMSPRDYEEHEDKICMVADDWNVIGADGRARCIGEGLDLLKALHRGLATELKAVSAKAQRRVRPPAGLDLSIPLWKPPTPEPPSPPATHATPTCALTHCSDASADSRAGSGNARQNRPHAVGPYYLQCDSPPPIAHCAASASSDASKAAPTPLACSCGNQVCADAAQSSTAVSLHVESFGDEGDHRPEVNMEEEMPEEAVLNESPNTSSVSRPLLHAASEQGRAQVGVQLLPLVDMATLDSPHAETAESAAGNNRRRRRKHRTSDKTMSDSQSEAPAEKDLLVAL